MIGSEDQASHTPQRPWLCACIITLACVAVFAGVARNAILHWDDRYHTIENPWFQTITRDSFAHFWGEPYGNLYIPVAYNVFAAEIWLTQRATGDSDIEKLNPLALQCFKIPLHAASAIMVFFIIRRLTRSDWPALAGALLFAVHPLQAESVAWISETRGLLGSVFGLGSILALARCAQDLHPQTSLAAERSRLLRTSDRLAGRSIQHSWWFIAAVLLSAAILSKPGNVTVPLIAAAWLWAIGRPATRIVLVVAPLLLISAAAVVVTQSVQVADVLPNAPAWWQRPLIASDAVLFYISKLVWPFDLAPDYGRTPTFVLAKWGGWWPCLALLLAAAATFTAIRFARRSRAALLALALPVLALLPVLGLATFHHQAISTVADRYAYLALLGPAILLAMWLERSRKPALWIVAAIAIAGCAWLSFVQVPHWRTDETLWRHAIAVNPSSPVGHNNLGREFQRQGRIAEAEPHLLRAIELDPTSPSTLINLGELRSAQNRPVEAEALYRRAIELSPGDVRGLIDLGILLAQTQRDDEARAILGRAVGLSPKHPEAQINLAVLDMRAGELEAASGRLERALADRPGHAHALYNLALVRAAQGRWKEAAELWDRAIVAGIATVEAFLRCGDAYVRAEMFGEAERTYLAAIAVHPTSYEPLNNLGLLYIRRGRIAEAVGAFERAARIAPEASEPRENLAAAKRLLEKTE